MSTNPTASNRDSGSAVLVERLHNDSVERRGIGRSPHLGGIENPLRHAEVHDRTALRLKGRNPVVTVMSVEGRALQDVLGIYAGLEQVAASVDFPVSNGCWHLGLPSGVPTPYTVYPHRQVVGEIR